MNNDKLAEALQKIVEWDPPPMKGRDGNMRSMVFEIGTNGVRDYFRDIAREALQAHAAEDAQAQAAEPVAVVERNANGQIRLATPSGDAFDMSRYIGARLYTHPQPAQAAKVCVWSEDEEGNWDTGCGNMFVLNEGTPYDNEMGFCGYCGGKLDHKWRKQTPR